MFKLSFWILKELHPTSLLLVLFSVQLVTLINERPNTERQNTKKTVWRFSSGVIDQLQYTWMQISRHSTFCSHCTLREHYLSEKGQVPPLPRAFAKEVSRIFKRETRQASIRTKVAKSRVFRVWPPRGWIYSCGKEEARHGAPLKRLLAARICLEFSREKSSSVADTGKRERERGREKKSRKFSRLHRAHFKNLLGACVCLVNVALYDRK